MHTHTLFAWLYYYAALLSFAWTWYRVVCILATLTREMLGAQDSTVIKLDL